MKNFILKTQIIFGNLGILTFKIVKIGLILLGLNFSRKIIIKFKFNLEFQI